MAGAPAVPVEVGCQHTLLQLEYEHLGTHDLLQVSAFGNDSGSDTGDVWTVQGYHAKDKFWGRDADIIFKCASCMLAVQFVMGSTSPAGCVAVNNVNYELRVPTAFELAYGWTTDFD